ncbi:helicase [Tanacetum coccineum]
MLTDRRSLQYFIHLSRSIQIQLLDVMGSCRVFVVVGTEVSCHNLDDPTYQCRGCNAIMWYGESVNKGNKDANPTFSLCFQQDSAIAKAFRMARDWFHSHVFVNMELRLLYERTSSRQYNAPTVTEVAALITNDFGAGEPTRDIVVNKKDSGPKRISELHLSYMALQYPLLFPYREDGYHDKISGGRLYQHYLVDAYTAIEEQRLNWMRNNQDTLRVDLYHNVCDVVTRGDTNAAGLGKRIVLLHTFTDSLRYMMQNYQDAMALCRAYGNPDLFITFTFNPKWPEISKMLAYIPRQRAHNHPEV